MSLRKKQKWSSLKAKKSKSWEVHVRMALNTYAFWTASASGVCMCSAREAQRGSRVISLRTGSVKTKSILNQQRTAGGDPRHKKTSTCWAVNSMPIRTIWHVIPSKFANAAETRADTWQVILTSVSPIGKAMWQYISRSRKMFLSLIRNLAPGYYHKEII